jgi:hypothetical protein
MPKRDEEIEKLLKENPKLAKYIDELEKAKAGRENSSRASKAKEKRDERREKAKEEDNEGLGAIDPRRFSLMKEIKNHPLYAKSNRDKKARTMVDEYKESRKDKITSKNNITPGQLVMFKYLNPKTKEELEYYDAAPCTIFFGIFNSKEGKRVLGFNVHYFPPQLRYRIMDRIYEMYKPVYRKYFETGMTKELDGFDYKYLTDELERQNLSFAVRMYIPQLIGDTYIVPPKMWPTAMMTEGWFKKETRAAIMNYFKSDAKSKHKLSAGAHSKGKAANKGKKK